MHIRYLSAAALVTLLAACGGGGGNAAVSKTFNYGAGQTPTTAENDAAVTAQANLNDSAGFSSTPDATKGMSIIGFADTLAAGAMGDAELGAFRPREADVSKAIRQAATDACATVTSTSVTFNNCTITESGFTLRINGSITVSAGKINWDVNASFSGTSEGVTVTVNLHQSGNLAVTSSTIKGQSLSEISVNASGQGQSVSAALHTAGIVDVTYQSTPESCVTAGSVEVKRVWAQKPSNATGPAFADLAVKLTWTGCHSFKVAHST